MSRVGRPSKRKGEKGIRVALMMYAQELEFLNNVELGIRHACGARIERSAIIRGILDALQESGLDLTSCESEDAVKATLLAALKKVRTNKARGTNCLRDGASELV